MEAINEIGMIGLGKMGLGLTQNMMRNGIRVIGYDKASRILI
jgi:6-phosphogluconate dehydrogenase (decarboxylating)